MIVRTQHRDDGPAVRQVLTDAFADGGRVAALAEALAGRPDRPTGPLVAEVNGELVGHVQLSRGWIDALPQLVDVLVLSPLGVVGKHQRSGIGRALCQAAIEQARRHAAPAVFLEGDPAYYSRIGWQRASGLGFTAPSTRIPEPGFQVIMLPAWQPWMVGAVVYNDTFWALDFVGLRDPA